ncbi:MAG: glycosyltransferase family 4 protein, partial [Vicinamibacteria bacterium]
WKSEAHMWGRYERRISDEADVSLAVSDELADALKALSPDARFAVVPQGVRIPDRQTRPGPDPVCVFLGTMNYDPNIDSVRWLARDIWPRVRAAVPGAELRVAGRTPHPSVAALGGNNGIRVLGEVPDLVEACDGGWVAASPLRAGWGVKTKSIELMAMGLPLVATPRGAEGMRAGAGLVIERDPAAFAAALIRLLTDRDAAAAAGDAARSYAATALPWDGPPRAYMALLEALTARSEDPAGAGDAR